MFSKSHRIAVAVIIVVIIFSLFSVSFALEIDAQNNYINEQEAVNDNNEKPENTNDSEMHEGLDINNIPMVTDEVGEKIIPRAVIDPTISLDSKKLPIGEVEEITLEEAMRQGESVATSQSVVEPPDIDKVKRADVKIVTGENVGGTSNEPGTASPQALIDEEFQGANATPGSVEAYGYFILYPKEILQIGMECPNDKNLDYDLYLYECDTSTGEIKNEVKNSTYTTYFNNDNTTLDEGVDIINTSNAKKAYMLAVYSRNGGDINKPYTVYYSIDEQGSYNFGENDQNAKKPCAVLLPGQYIEGIALNSKSDNDWFNLQVTVPNAYEYIDVRLKGDANDKIELYKEAENGTMKMQKIYPNGDQYRFMESETVSNYYIRVVPNDRNSHTWHQYRMEVMISEARAKPHSITIEDYACEENKTTGNWILWPEGYHYSYAGKWLDVFGTVYDVFGDPVADGFEVVGAYKSEAWPESSGNRERIAKGYYTNDSGKYKLTFDNLPPSIWDRQVYNSVSNLIHFYSLCKIGVGIGNDEYVGTVEPVTDTIYMWSHAMQPF